MWTGHIYCAAYGLCCGSAVTQLNGAEEIKQMMMLVEPQFGFRAHSMQKLLRIPTGRFHKKFRDDAYRAVTPVTQLHLQSLHTIRSSSLQTAC